MPLIKRYETKDFANRLLGYIRYEYPREAVVIYLRNYEQMTWINIGDVLGVSKERARQMYNKGLHRLKRVSLEKYGVRDLRGFFD